MSNYVLYPPTPSFIGLRIKTKDGIADIQVKNLNKKGPWRYIDKEQLTGYAAYTIEAVSEAYKAGYQDGMCRPIKEKVLFQKNFLTFMEKN